MFNKKNKATITEKKSFLQIFLYVNTCFYWLAIDNFNTCLEIKYSTVNMKTNISPFNCPNSMTQKDVRRYDWLAGDIPTHVLTAVRKTIVRLVHDNCKTEVQFFRILQVASGNSSTKKIVCDTYDWHVKLPFVLRCTRFHLNTIVVATISHGSQD